MEKKDIRFLNENNISLLLGSKIHLVAYAINAKNEFNLITIIRKNLNKKDLNDDHFFNDKENIRKFIKDSSIQKNDELKNLFDNVKDIKCFPTFISDKIRQSNKKNTFFLGDAFYASLPTFAQGASQSIESAYELLNTLNEDNIILNYFSKNKIIHFDEENGVIECVISHLESFGCKCDVLGSRIIIVLQTRFLN